MIVLKIASSFQSSSFRSTRVPDMSDTKATRVQHECDTSATRTTRVKNFNLDNGTSENIFSHFYISYLANEKLKGEEQFHSKNYNHFHNILRLFFFFFNLLFLFYFQYKHKISTKR